MNKFLHFNVNFEPGTSTKIRKKYQSRTAVITPLPAQEIKDIVKHFLNVSGSTLSVQLDVGITLLSLKDKYSKKEGRAEATKRIKKVSLDVKAVQITQNHIFVRLAEYAGIVMMLRLNKTSSFSTVVGTMNIGE